MVARSVKCFDLGASIAFRILPPLDAALCCRRWFFPDFTCWVARCTMPRRVKSITERPWTSLPSSRGTAPLGSIALSNHRAHSCHPLLKETQNVFFVRTRESDPVALFGRPFQRLPKFCWCIVWSPIEFYRSITWSEEALRNYMYIGHLWICDPRFIKWKQSQG